MKPTIIQQSATEIKITTQVDEVVSLDDLRAEHDDAVKSLDDFEAWVTAERAGRQAMIDDLQLKLDEAAKLGVVSAAASIAIL